MIRTSNYNLGLWEGVDFPNYTMPNENMNIIDGELAKQKTLIDDVTLGINKVTEDMETVKSEVNTEMETVKEEVADELETTKAEVKTEMETVKSTVEDELNGISIKVDELDKYFPKITIGNSESKYQISTFTTKPYNFVTRTIYQGKMQGTETDFKLEQCIFTHELIIHGFFSQESKYDGCYLVNSSVFNDGLFTESTYEGLAPVLQSDTTFNPTLIRAYGRRSGESYIIALYYTGYRINEKTYHNKETMEYDYYPPVNLTDFRLTIELGLTLKE